jgi:hypothetical protein
VLVPVGGIGTGKSATDDLDSGTAGGGPRIWGKATFGGGGAIWYKTIHAYNKEQQQLQQ